MTNQSFQFGTIAVAVAFSPRIEAIMAESKRLQEIFQSRMIFIHVGEQNLQEEQYLKHLIHRFGLDQEENLVIWEHGDTVERILSKCDEYNVDLLVAGALERERLLKYFMGSVARQLCRKAKCSILMLREPSITPRLVARIVVEGSDHPKTVNTIQAALYVAKKCNAFELHIIQESDMSKMALIRLENLSNEELVKRKEIIFREENEKLNEVLKCSDCNNLNVKMERIEGKPGYMISSYARENKADLLILNSPDKKMNLLDRVFPHDIEYALSNLPCDLLVVHSKSIE